MSKWQTSSSLPVAATGGMDFMRLALVVYDPDGVIDRPTWSQEHYWTEDVLYTLVWAGQGWMWNRDWGPYALAAIDTVGEESPIRKNADCYVELSEEEAGNPRQALSKIHRVLSRHPLVAVPWPVLVDRSWKLEPKKTAVSCGRKKISYEEFVGYGGIVQGYCLERAGPGEHVMVTFSDTPESRLTWAVVMYALSASGVPFSIMDRRTLPNAPARERLLERWQPRLWICCDPEGHGKGEGGMADIPARVNVELDLTEKTVVVDGQATRVRFPPRAPEILATAESVCFVDWTSGSTSGLPKGVETTHRTLINMMLWAWGDEKMFFHGGAKHEVVAANLFLLWYWWQPICVGASAVLVEDKELSDLEVHIALLDDEKVSIVDCITPSLLGAMVDYAAAGETEKSLPRTMVVSGEPLSEQVCRKFLKSQPKGARLVNLFSTTETGDAAYCPITEEQLPLWTGMVTFAPIGTPIWNVKLHIEDIKDDSGASGEGELFVEHAGGIMSYVNDAEQTARGFSSHHGWRSRDRVKEIQGVGLVIVGRADDNVKIRGFKVDLRLVEARCRDLSGLSEVCVMVDEEALVVAYTSPNAEVKPNELIDFCWREVREGRLPDSHVPQRALLWQGGSFPMMKTGKIDKTKVKEKVQAVRRGPSRARSGDMGSGSLIQARVAAVWRDTLGCECDLDGSFWRECGGQSLTAMRIAAALRIPAKLILDGTLDTPRDIIYFLTRSQHSSPREVHVAKGERGMAEKDHRIAVIGASGRWPGIGQTSLSALLEALSGKLVEFNPFVAPPDGHTGAGNVPGGYYLESALVSGFDEAFWSQRGVSDATLIDPHQRIWLEMAYESLLDGGFGPVMERGEAINCGVFVSGGSLPHYLSLLLEPGETLPSLRVSDPDRYFTLEMGNDKDYLAMRTSHALNLTGPSMSIGTACSSALVALCQAVEALRNGTCQTALCGGVSLILPQNEHASQEGMIWSSDGKCKPFTDAASGTANCNGGHCFLLKPYEDALRDDDPVYCLISGVGVCNDGAGKPFSAPSVAGHERAIRAAQADCDDDIFGKVGMIEAHATGTYVGDPIEAEALTGQYHREKGRGAISIGSVKGNVGHANTAAGALGFAKAAMCVYEGVLVPSGSAMEGNINPLLAYRLESSNMKLQRIFEPWTETPRAAAVSALGIGGTNAHVIIESGPALPKATETDEKVYFPLSADTMEALQDEAKALAKFLEVFTGSPADVAYTLARFRPSLGYRYVAETSSAQLSDMDLENAVKCLPTCNCVTLVCPGQGLSLPSPGSISIDPAIIYLLGEDPLVTYSLNPNPVTQQVALFSVSYSTCLRIIKLVSQTTTVQILGASLGEWVAATVSGVMPLEEALEVVRLRAWLITEGNTGKMLAITGMTTEELLPLPDGIELACVNADKRIVVSGSLEAIESYKATLEVPSKILDTAGAFHSVYVDKAVGVLKSEMPRLVPHLRQPSRCHLISTASLEGPIDFTSVDYWCTQTRRTVMLARALKKASAGGTAFIDVGPGAGMRTLIRECVPESEVLCAARYLDKSDQALKSALWSAGFISDPPVPEGDGFHRVLSLPTRSWIRRKCWPPEHNRSLMAQASSAESDLANITYTEVWQDLPKLDDEVASDRFAGFSFGGEAPDYEDVVWCSGVSDFDIAVKSFGRCVLVVAPEESVDPVELLGDFITFVQESLIPIGRRLSHMDTLLIIQENQCTSPLIGFARSLLSEHGGDLGLRILRTLNMNQFKPSVSLPRLAELRLADGTVKLRQLVRKPLKTTTTTSDLKHCIPEGIVVVTGAFGGLGRLVTKWAADNLSCRRIVLVGRSTHGQTSSFDSPCPIDVRLADVSDPVSVVNALTEYHGQVSVVLHCAGVVEDALVENASSNYEDLHRCLGAKALGPPNLMAALGPEPYYVLFSSSSSAFGSPGQSVYAAANSATDYFADHSAKNILAVQWGGWSKSIEGSMSAKYNVNPSAGERFLQPNQGLGALGILLAQLATRELTNRSAIVADIPDWQEYLSASGLPREAPLWGRILPAPSRSWVPTLGQLSTDPKYSWMLDHKTDDGALVPATAMVLWLLNHPRESSGALEKVAFHKVLWLDKGEGIEVDRGEVRSGHTVYASAASSGPVAPGQPNYIKSVLSSGLCQEGPWESVEVGDLYKNYSESGFPYGPSFRLLRSARQHGDLLVAAVADGAHLAAVMDACTHACALLDEAAFGGLPSSISHVRLELDSPTVTDTTDWTVVVKRSQVNSLAYSFDLLMQQPSSGRCITFEGFTMQTTTAPPMTLNVYREGDPVPFAHDDIRRRVMGSSSSVIRSMVGPIDIPKLRERPQDLRQYVLTPAGNGELDATFAPEEVDDIVPTGFIKVNAKYWGISFLDALAATGAMPMSFFGGEFCGEVAAIGEGVDTIKVGDIVGCVTLGANGLHSSMTLPAHYCHKVPAGITPSVAAALPMSLATAILALDLRAGLGRGPSKTVLVHSAAGGVGLCCVALLRMRGHDIIGTCNLRDDRKVEMLKSLGVSRIFDSRNVSSWYVPMMSGEAPRPEAIIGALDGDQFARSFEVVASNGYILDLAKKEQMLDQATVPLSHFLRGVTYSACHLDEFMRTAPPSEVTDLMNKVWETASAVGQSAMQSMPVSVYPGEHLKQALEVLTTGRNVGKVVVELEPPEGHVVSSDLVVDLRNSSDQVLLEGAALVVSTLESTFLAKAPTVTVRAGQKLPIDLLRSLVHLPAQGHAYVALSGPPELPALPVWHSCCESSSASTGTSNKLSILVTAVRQRSSAAALDGLSDEDLANMTLEELGFDSLARLQLSSLIRKLSPGGRSLVGSELVGHLPLSSIACTKPKSAGRSKSHRPRWLALHGFRMNGDFFAQQLAGLADFLGVEFVFVNAPHQAHGPGYGEKGGIADGFEWWWKGDSADTTYDSGWIGSEGLKTSQDFLRQQLERVKPEGVVGFSQGGGMAYWMLCRGLVKNGLIFSPVGPDTDESLSPQSESTVVVVRSTQKDEASAAYCQNVLKCDFLAHEEGHVVPSCGSEKYKELYDTVKKQLDL